MLITRSEKGKRRCTRSMTSFAVVAQMAAGSGVNINLNCIVHASTAPPSSRNRREESLRATDVRRDLGAKFVGRIELPSSRSRCKNSDALSSPSGTGAFKNERFDRQCRFAKRRPDADIGDGIHERTAIQRMRRDVNAALRDQLVFRLEIQRGNCHGPASARA